LVLSAIGRVAGFDLQAALAASSREARTFHKVRVLCLVAFLVLVWAAQVYDRSFALILARDHPLVLVALDGRGHNIVLAAVRAAAVPLLAIAAVSRFVDHLLYYLLGRWAGEAALRALQQRAGRVARLVRRGEQSFARVGNLAVLVLSDRPVCVLAGAAMMSPLRFIALHLPGTVVRVWAAVLFARSSSGVVGPWLVRLEAHATLVTIATVAVTVVWIAALAYAGRRRAPVDNNDDSKGEE
jgi:membrane protein DedA with SNARE-associated domain